MKTITHTISVEVQDPGQFHPELLLDAAKRAASVLGTASIVNISVSTFENEFTPAQVGVRVLDQQEGMSL